jgi:GH35 family endo-1,4-beta-xylanase
VRWWQFQVDRNQQQGHSLVFHSQFAEWLQEIDVAYCQEFAFQSLVSKQHNKQSRQNIKIKTCSGSTQYNTSPS